MKATSWNEARKISLIQPASVFLRFPVNVAWLTARKTNLDDVRLFAFPLESFYIIDSER